jgi:hypothetical protein
MLLAAVVHCPRLVAGFMSRSAGVPTVVPPYGEERSWLRTGQMHLRRRS